MDRRIPKQFRLFMALVALVVFLSACGNDEPEAVVVPAEPTTAAVVETPTAAVTEAVTETVPLTEEVTLTDTGVAAGDVTVITSTRLITGTEVTTDVVVTTDTVVLARELITTVIVATDVMTDVVLTDTQQTTQTESTFVTETARITPQVVPGVVGAVVVVGVVDADNRYRSASTLLGYPVVNLEGAAIGQLSDMVVNLETGNVAFAILDYGGAIDIGDNRLPLPLSAFRFDAANEALVLAVEEGTLEGQSGFGADWPNLRDPGYIEETAAFWEGLNTDVIAPEVVNALRTTTGVLTTASQLIGITIQDPAGAGFGMIQDLLVSLADGRIAYAVVASGGNLDLGQDLVVVPLAAFDFAQRVPTLAVEPTVLEGAPRFDPNWTVGDAEPTWVEEIESYWADLF